MNKSGWRGVASYSCFNKAETNGMDTGTIFQFRLYTATNENFPTGISVALRLRSVSVGVFCFIYIILFVIAIFFMVILALRVPLLVTVLLLVYLSPIFNHPHLPRPAREFQRRSFHPLYRHSTVCTPDRSRGYSPCNADIDCDLILCTQIYKDSKSRLHLSVVIGSFCACHCTKNQLDC